ncbi:MAG: antiterminator LoaP [Bacillota bacterium]
MNWYALHVRTNREESVKDWINYHFNHRTVNAVIPKRKLTEKRSGKIYYIEKNIFPGYILINTYMDDKIYYTLKKIPNTIKLLSDAHYFTKIDEKELHPILNLLDDEYKIDISKAFFEGSTVYFKEGPLVGMEGIIAKINKHTRRAKVELNFMGELRSFDVGIDFLEKEYDRECK